MEEKQKIQVLDPAEATRAARAAKAILEYPDADAAGTDALKITRSGTTVTEFEINATLIDINGVIDSNQGVALGGGSSATLGTIGGSGPTSAGQAQWLEISIGGTSHWIPVWT